MLGYADYELVNEFSTWERLTEHLKPIKKQDLLNAIATYAHSPSDQAA